MIYLGCFGSDFNASIGKPPPADLITPRSPQNVVEKSRCDFSTPIFFSTPIGVHHRCVHRQLKFLLTKPEKRRNNSESEFQKFAAQRKQNRVEFSIGSQNFEVANSTVTSSRRSIFEFQAIGKFF